MNRQEYIELVNDWNNFLLKEEKLLYLESYIINEGIGRTLKMFTMPALMLIASNVVDLHRGSKAQAQPPTSITQQQDPELEDWGSMDKVNLSAQKEKDIDESSRALIMNLTLKGYTFDGTKKGKGQDELVRQLKDLELYKPKEIKEFFQHNSYSVKTGDVVKAIDYAVKKARDAKKNKIDEEFLLRKTSEISKFEGYEKIEKLINSVKPKIASTYNETKQSIRKYTYKKIDNNEERFERAKNALEAMSKGFQSRGVNSNDAKAMVLILMGVNLETSQIVNTVKSINNRGSSGASLNPQMQRHLNIVGLIVDFSLSESEEYKNDATREIFNSADGVDIYSLLESIRKQGYEFQLKIKKKIEKLLLTSEVTSKADAGEATGNPQAYIDDID